MEMVRDERPGVTLGPGGIEDFSEPFKERFAILIVAENL
jgi:hypothetical protein